MNSISHQASLFIAEIKKQLYSDKRNKNDVEKIKNNIKNCNEKKRVCENKGKISPFREKIYR